MSKNRYATSFIAMYKMDILDTSTKASIPRSTRHYWQTVSIDEYIGFELDQVWDERRLYMQALMKSNFYFQLCKSMYVLFECYKGIIFSSQYSKKMIRSNKSIISKAYKYACRHSSKKLVSKFIGIPFQRINSWNNTSKCVKSVFNSCMVKHPSQLSVREYGILKGVLTDERFEALPLSYRWAQLVRTSPVAIGISTFYKYAKVFLVERCQYIKPSSNVESPKAGAPFRILHMDSTVVKAFDGSRIYIHFIMDNFSRTILSATASYSAKSGAVAENLKAVLHKYGLVHARDLQIFCDDGPENNGAVNVLLDSLKVEKVIATYKHNSTNNMIEAFNKKFKRFVIYDKVFDSLESLQKLLPELVEYYNNLYQPVLQKRSPNEVLTGTKPIDITQQMAEAKIIRRQENKESCCF